MRARFQEGSLRVVGKKYKAQYRVYDEATGKSIRKTDEIGLVAEMSKREAKAKMRDIVMKGTEQLPQTPGPTVDRLGTALEQFYNERFLAAKLPLWSEPQRKTFTEITKRYVMPKFGPMALGKIDSHTVQTHLNNLAEKYSKATVRHARGSIISILNVALDQEFVPRNVAAKTVIPRIARKARQPICSKEQLISLIERITDARDKAIFLVGTFCAMRSSEIFGLSWRQLIFDEENYQPGVTEGAFMVDQVAYEGKVYKDQTKTDNSKAEVYIDPFVLKWVVQWRKEAKDTSPDTLMFPSNNKNGRARKGAPMYPGIWLSKKIQPLAELVGITEKVNFRMTRRTASTHMHNNGASPASTAAHLRHSVDVNRTVYTKAIPEEVKKAVNGYVASVLGASQSKPKLMRVK